MCTGGVHDDMTLGGARNVTALFYTMLALELASQCLYISGNIVTNEAFFGLLLKLYHTFKLLT